MSKVDVFGILDVLQSKYVKAHQNRCVVVRNRNAGCTRCADACTSGAIALVDNEVVITPDKCIGCGTCATVCPTCALESATPNDAELMQSCVAAARLTEGEVVIVCEQLLEAAGDLFEHEKVAQVVCLGRIDESLLISLVTAGAEGISLVKANCEECEHCVGLKTAEAVVETTNTLLDTWNNPLHVEILSFLPEALLPEEELGYDPSRRSFFLGMSGKAKTVASKIMDGSVKKALNIEEVAEPRYQKVMADGTLPHFIPDRRERLLDQLAKFGEPKDAVIQVRLWGQVIIDTDLCNGCTMCTTFCPTSALVKQFEEGTDKLTALEHYPGDCVKCLCCQDICPQAALVVSDNVWARDLLSGYVDRYEISETIFENDHTHLILSKMQKLLGLKEMREQ